MTLEARFQRVLDEFGDAIWRLTAGYATDPDARQDLRQEILVGLWEALPRFREESSLRTFVFRLAHNRGISHRAYEGRRRHGSLDDRPLSSSLPDPLEHTEGVMTRDRLLDAVRQLSPALRQPLMLRLEGLENREIASILDIQPGAVAVRLTRARDALRPLLLDAT